MSISTLSKLTVPLASNASASGQGVTLDVYNSKVYLAGKHTWEPITLNLREDVNNNVQKLVGEQLQKQFDFFEQSAAASGSDYKFLTRIEILDGGNGALSCGAGQTLVPVSDYDDDEGVPADLQLNGQTCFAPPPA